MVVGLGTGSTSRYLIEAVGKALEEGTLRDIRAVPTSQVTAVMASNLGIPLSELTERGVDVAIDGMDEVTPALDAIKGLGGALTREKIVATRAAEFILIGDQSKRVTHLGEKAPVPVEVVPFGYQAALADLTKLACKPVLRLRGDRPTITDNGNYLIDCYMETPFDPRGFITALSDIPGILEHGLFLGVAKLAYVAGTDGVNVMHPIAPGA